MQGSSEVRVSTVADALGRTDHDESDVAVAGPLASRLADIRPILLAFARALGGDPDDLSDLPFTETAGTDAMPEPLYVRHDEAMLQWVVDRLVAREHVGLCSDPGTGKTTLVRILERELGTRDDFVVASVDDPETVTPRGVAERVLRAASAEGYTVNPESYWQVDDGVPWNEAEIGRAVWEVTADATADDTRVLLVVDECENLSPALREQLRTVADAGVRLFMLGTPAARPAFEELDESLAAPLNVYDGIDTFDAEDVAEYTARSLASLRDEEYDRTPSGLFSGDTIHHVAGETGGNPRAVRVSCLDLFTRAAFVWHDLDVDAERVTITPELTDQDLPLANPTPNAEN